MRKNLYMTSPLPLLLLFLLGSLGAGMARGDILIDVTPKPNPPDSGENSLAIELKDESGKAVDAAIVSVDVFMPSMGTMPRMEEKVTVTPKGSGQYFARFDLPMAGTWEFSIRVQKGNATSLSHYSLTTGVSGVSLKGGSAGRSEANSTQSLYIGPDRLQTIGVRFAEAKTLSLKREIEAVGVIEQDQTHREEVSLRYSGYVVKQFRGRVGESVKSGDPLFSIYSPDLVTAQSEFLLANKILDGGHSLHAAASEKMKNLGLSANDIGLIRKSGQPIRDIVIRSPANGTVLDISVREGSSVNAGQLLYTIGDLSRTFLVARVFQQDIRDVKVGQDALVTVPGAELEPLTAKVNLIYPQIDQGAGTVNVRLEVAGASASLKPGAYMDVAFPIEMGSHLTIPAEAVLYSGRHRYVFVNHGNGRLEPREVSVGKSIKGMLQVFDGLKERESIAASGTFLLGSEAQLRSALPKWIDRSTQDAPKDRADPQESNPGNHHEGHP